MALFNVAYESGMLSEKLYTDFLLKDRGRMAFRGFFKALLDLQEDRAILWHCTDGKDRTGMMDVECKFLATLAVLGKDVPEPGAQLNAEQKMLYRNLLLQSGNHEMQKYNTGIAGYKVEGVGSITERIGDIASQRMFLGASKIVNS